MPIPKYVYVKDQASSGDDPSISLFDEDCFASKSSLELGESHSSLSLRSWRSRWDASEVAACGHQDNPIRPNNIHWMRNLSPVIHGNEALQDINTPATVQRDRTEQRLQLPLRSFATMGPRPPSPSQPKLTFALPKRLLRKSGRVRGAPKVPVRKLSNPPPSESLAALFQEKAHANWYARHTERERSPKALRSR